MRTIVSGGWRTWVACSSLFAVRRDTDASLPAMIAPVVDAAWTAAHRDELVLADVRWYLDGRPGRAEYDRGPPARRGVRRARRLARRARDAAGGPPPAARPGACSRAGWRELGIGDARHRRGLRRPGRRGRRAAGVDAARDRPRGRAARRRHRAPGRARSRPSRPRRAPAAFTARPWPAEALASADDAADPANAVIDARQRERYLGEGPDPVDPRPGHIPGARSLPAREHLGEDGRLLARDELRRRFAAAGVDGSKPGRLLLRLRRHRLPQPDRARARRARHRAGCTPARGRSGARPDRPAATGEERMTVPPLSATELVAAYRAARAARRSRTPTPRSSGSRRSTATSTRSASSTPTPRWPTRARPRRAGAAASPPARSTACRSASRTCWSRAAGRRCAARARSTRPARGRTTRRSSPRCAARAPCCPARRRRPSWAGRASPTAR